MVLFLPWGLWQENFVTKDVLSEFHRILFNCMFQKLLYCTCKAQNVHGYCDVKSLHLNVSLDNTLICKTYTFYKHFAPCSVALAYKNLNQHANDLSNYMVQRLWEANRSLARQETPTFYGTQRFVIAFTRSRHLSISFYGSSHLHLGLPSGLTLRLLHQYPVCNSPLTHTCYMHRQSRSSGFDHKHNTWWVQIIKLRVM